MGPDFWELPQALNPTPYDIPFNQVPQNGTLILETTPLPEDLGGLEEGQDASDALLHTWV